MLTIFNNVYEMFKFIYISGQKYKISFNKKNTNRMERPGVEHFPYFVLLDASQCLML
jgi:hypothetical protein